MCKMEEEFGFFYLPKKQSWHESFVGKSRKEHGTIPLCLVWTVWRERNQMAFENVKHLLGGSGFC